MKLLLLDRDGVINEDSDDYIKSVAEWRPVPGAIEAIARVSQAGWRVFVVSNQSGIGRGLFDYDALFAIHARLHAAVAARGGTLDGIAFAPDHPERATDMRKPGAGMLCDLARRLQCDLAGVPFVGDSASDLEAARAVGARPILVRTGKGQRTELEQKAGDATVFADLSAVADALLGQDQRPQTA